MKISEISVSYSNSKEEKLKVKNSKDSFEILLDSWDKNIIELQEEFESLISELGRLKSINEITSENSKNAKKTIE